MVTLDYFLMCETVIRDTEGRLTFVNIFDALNMPELPATPAKFGITFGIYVDKSDVKKGKVHFRMAVVDPTGKEIVAVEGSGEVQPSTVEKRRRVAGSADLAVQVPISSVGDHKIVLYVNDQLIGEKKLEVNKV